MGGAVATGFAAKHSPLVVSLSLLSPMGIRFRSPVPRRLLQGPSLVAALVAGWSLRGSAPEQLKAHVEMEFYDLDQATTHRHLVDKQLAMLNWQLYHRWPFLTST